MIYLVFYDSYPELIWHYCSISNFYSIANSKTLWLCNGLNMNDKLDSVYLESEAINWLIQEYECSSNNDKRAFIKECQNIIQFAHIERPIPFLLALVKKMICLVNGGLMQITEMV